MNTYIVGIDGGGTKTTAKILFHSGRPPVYITGGPLNICSVGKEQLENTLSQLISQIQMQAGTLQNCVGIGIGAAGTSNPEAVPFLKAYIEQHTGCNRVNVTSDAFIALCGALEAPVGVILIAGTGSICYGANANGAFWRTGGAGHLIDDEGSGYAVGRDILSAAVKALDGRGSDTMLLELLKRQKKLTSLSDVIAFAYSSGTDKSVIASLAPLLTPACDSTDRVALAIACRAAKALFKMADAVIERLCLAEDAIALRGSILQKEAYIFIPIIKMLQSRYPRINIVSSKGDAVDGALYLATELDFFGLPTGF